MAGSAHQRKVIATAVNKALTEAGSSAPLFTVTPPASQLSITARFHRFFDHGALQTLLGIIGGLVGTLLDGRYLAFLCLWIAWAINRSTALEGIRVSRRIMVYLAALLISAPSLYFMGVKINMAKPHTYTPADYFAAFKNGTPLPISQQITNVYKTYISPPKAIGEPRVDISEFWSDGVAADGALLWHNNAVNNGTVPALDRENSTKWMVGPRSTATENELFDFLYKASHDDPQPRSDQPPGEEYSANEPLTMHLSMQDRVNIQSGETLYLGRVQTYGDASGNRFATDVCMFYIPTSTKLIYCDGHNKSRKLASR